MTDNLSLIQDSYFTAPLYIMFSMLNIKRDQQEIAKRISPTSEILVFEIEGALISKKTKGFRKSKQDLTDLYAIKCNNKINNITQAYYKHLSTPKLFWYECGMHPQTFWELKEQFRYDEYVVEDLYLREVLLKGKELGYKLVVHSSESLKITQNVLKLLMIEDVFDVIFYVCRGNKDLVPAEDCFIQKPMREANELLIKLLGVKNPAQIIMIDRSQFVMDSGHLCNIRGIKIEPKDGLGSILEEFYVQKAAFNLLYDQFSSFRFPYGKDEERKGKPPVPT